MTTPDIILLIAILLAAIPAWLLVLRKRDGISKSEMEELLTQMQRQFDEDLTKQRESIERVQHEISDSLKLTFETRTDALKTSINETLSKSRESQDKRLDKVDEVLRDLITQFKNAQADLQEKLHKTLKTQGEENKNAILTLQERVGKELTELREQQQAAAVKLGEDVNSSLEKVSKANEDKLEKIRLTVDEKLHETLEKRLGEQFTLVLKQLERVQSGLGEMQNLASGVGDLKRVLTNVRSRGTFGEIQLEALLEQVFTPAQYDKNCITVPNSNERVEFALILPGRGDDDSPVLLPIDSKFPVEARERLEQAIEDGDKDAYTAAQKELGRLLLAEAQKIQSKYVSPPHTTDFALLFIPTEGLYAEILRVPGLAEKMHELYHIVPVGPMNLLALLNSLQMGFRTLAIEKRSAEVWNILGAVKTEFGKFGETLEAVSKKLTEAQNKIAKSKSKTTTIARKLKNVEELPSSEAANLLSDPLADSSPLVTGSEEDK